MIHQRNHHDDSEKPVVVVSSSVTHGNDHGEVVKAKKSQTMVLFCIDISGFSGTVQFAILACGILGFFILSSYWEEYLFRFLPGFKFGWYLTSFQLVCMAGFALVERVASNEPAFHYNASLYRHWIVAAAMTASRGLTNVSLMYLNYPTQVVFKSLKLITVMIGSVITGKGYSKMEYLAAVFTVISAIFFGLGDVDVAPQFSVVGISIVLVSLIADSAHSNSQEALLTIAPMATLPEVMVFSNLFAAILSGLVCLFTGEVWLALEYCSEHPISYIIFVAHAVVTYIGVLFFVTTIKQFGVVMATTVTTVRKITTVLLSFILFPKPMTDKYLYGTMMFILSFVIHYYSKPSGVQLQQMPKEKKEHQEKAVDVELGIEMQKYESED